MQKPQLVSLLEDANLAHKAGDFTNALKFYEAFFDQAAEQDPQAFYAMRLSHCLTGWAELAETFPAALNRLNAKRREVLDQYQTQHVPELFHDYLEICRVLGRDEEALETFLQIRSESSEHAQRLVKYVWDDLIARQYWQVCSDVLEQPSAKLDELFALYKEAIKLKSVDTSFDTPQFEHYVVEQLLTGIENLVQILRHAGRTDELAQLQNQFHVVMHKIKDHQLNKQVQAKGAYLFSGH